MSEITTTAFDAPGATITYDVHGPVRNDVPLLLIGSPMDASGFLALAAQFRERTVVTYDPRGTARSTRDDLEGDLLPTDHVADLHALVGELGGGPVDVFASSGGAVNALAWVAAHPEDIRALVAHEPPTPTVLPDRDALLRAVDDIVDTYRDRGHGAGMAQFITLVGLEGELPPDYALPVVDPAQFGLPGEDDGTRGDPLLEQNMHGCNHHRPDLEGIRTASSRVLLGVGQTSAGTMAARSARALAEQTGRSLVELPGDHIGFTPAEWGMGGDPAAFATALREVLRTD